MVVNARGADGEGTGETRYGCVEGFPGKRMSRYPGGERTQRRDLHWTQRLGSYVKFLK